ncbi:MAG: hypothetical protein NVS3B7_12060 [Candidatus Elarobacter sp.]
MMRWVLCVAAMSSALGAPAHAAGTPGTSISDERLKTNAAAQGKMPFECGDAYQATHALAVDRNPSVETLHTVVRADIACLKSRYGGGETHNLALLSAASAALLAAHKQQGGGAHNDRVLALKLSRYITNLETGGGGLVTTGGGATLYQSTDDPNAHTAQASEFLDDAIMVHAAALAELKAETAAPNAAPPPLGPVPPAQPVPSATPHGSR